jgi:hypothetical protein
MRLTYEPSGRRFAHSRRRFYFTRHSRSAPVARALLPQCGAEQLPGGQAQHALATARLHPPVQ